MKAVLAIFLSGVIAFAAGLCLIATVPEMTRLQVATVGMAVFALICAPSLAAIVATQIREREDETEAE